MHALDLSGLNCPLPVLKTKKFLAEIAPGIQVRIITTDPASVADLQEFCHKTGHKLISQSTENGNIISIIEHK